MSIEKGLASGGVYLPGDEGYDQARTTWALAVDLRPAAVAFPRTVEEVAAVVRYAARAGLRVAPLGTGHNAHPLEGVDLSRTVLMRMSELKGIEIHRRTARVHAGDVWLPVVEKAAEHGLATLHGSSPDTGVVGYLLGGGLSWYARAHGLAANTVTAVELVTADGMIVRADADHRPDLFWALRGGNGANFGVVTAIEFRLFPIETAYAGMMVWDLAEAHRVLSAWAPWSVTAPDAASTCFRLLRFPPIPEVPEVFRGRHLVVVDGAVLGDDAEAQEILAPLRALDPAIDTFARVPVAALARLHLDPEQPVPGGGRSALLDALPPEAIDRLIEAAGPASDTILNVVDIRQLGGALGRVEPDAGAAARFDGQFLMLAAGILIGDLAKQTIADAERTVDAVSQWSRGRMYLNFDEVGGDASRGFDPDDFTRLCHIRDAVDPNRLFLANHELPATLK
ncbi:oxidoreductase [Asanoa ishikariensis]|uniref:FAD/FMN-containing dehydrogenase n=1 Tax=Asanoa ishikariensis TaxID=137265 RepID=A0A1H3T9M2_9ACTN|nr:FAD-binding protein [Asanoa ishikariensis]GIF62832.1 oxidoreductase [Asanoa ishikariensis]SDZ46800.1 FAD/FMN-containing dehydrogenase [Asanoa ishikariensis]